MTTWLVPKECYFLRMSTPFLTLYAYEHYISSLQDNIFNVVLAIWLLAVAICLGNYAAFIKSKRDYFSTSDYFADSNVNPVIQDLHDKHSNTVIAAAVSVYIKLFWLGITF